MNYPFELPTTLPRKNPHVGMFHHGIRTRKDMNVVPPLFRHRHNPLLPMFAHAPTTGGLLDLVNQLGLKPRIITPLAIVLAANEKEFLSDKDDDLEREWEIIEQPPAKQPNAKTIPSTTCPNGAAPSGGASSVPSGAGPSTGRKSSGSS